MQITFIRHTSVKVDKSLCYGKTDVALADTFPEEMLRIRQAIGTTRYDAVFASPLSRCRQLATELVDTTPVVFDERLMELDFGDWEMLAWDAIFASAAGKIWFDDYVNVQCPNGEAFTDQLARMASFLDCLRTRNRARVLVFTHAGCIRAALSLLNRISATEAINTPLDYGHIVTLKLENDESSN